MKSSQYLFRVIDPLDIDIARIIRENHNQDVIAVISNNVLLLVHETFSGKFYKGDNVTVGGSPLSLAWGNKGDYCPVAVVDGKFIDFSEWDEMQRLLAIPDEWHWIAIERNRIDSICQEVEKARRFVRKFKVIVRIL